MSTMIDNKDRSTKQWEYQEQEGVEVIGNQDDPSEGCVCCPYSQPSGAGGEDKDEGRTTTQRTISQRGTTRSRAIRG